MGFLRSFQLLDVMLSLAITSHMCVKAANFYAWKKWYWKKEKLVLVLEAFLRREYWKDMSIFSCLVVANRSNIGKGRVRKNLQIILKLNRKWKNLCCVWILLRWRNGMREYEHFQGFVIFFTFWLQPSLYPPTFCFSCLELSQIYSTTVYLGILKWKCEALKKWKVSGNCRWESFIVNSSCPRPLTHLDAHFNPRTFGSFIILLFFFFKSLVTTIYMRRNINFFL